MCGELSRFLRCSASEKIYFESFLKLVFIVGNVIKTAAHYRFVKGILYSPKNVYLSVYVCICILVSFYVNIHS